MTQWGKMTLLPSRIHRRGILRTVTGAFAAAVAGPLPRAIAQESYAIFQPSPRVLLSEERLRLLRREVERRTERWVQLELLLQGGAQFPEPAFAHALGHLVTNEDSLARKAISAVTLQTSLAHVAIVRDWCREALSPAEKQRLDSRLSKALQEFPNDLHAPAPIRDLALAAVALADDEPQASGSALRWIHTQWWPRQIDKIERGQMPVAHGDALPFVEILYSFQKGLQLDLREDAVAFFRDYPIWHLLRHYPASLHGGENDYRVPVLPGDEQPDPEVSVRSRAAELAMVALDTNAEASQYLQGWLLNPRFRMRSAYGAPYEFLWCNPYQPSLSYFYLPLYQHLPKFGSLMARSAWEEDARWFGLIDGQLQYFSLDGIQVLSRPAGNVVFSVGPASIVLEGTANPPDSDSVAEIPECDRVFWLGLKPSAAYLVEIDEEELTEAQTDQNGILALDFLNRPGGSVFVRCRPS